MPTADFQLRAAESDAELRRIEALARRIWPKTYDGILSPEQLEYMLHMMYDLSVLRRELAEGVCFRILYDGEIPIGFFSCGPYREGVAKLHKLYLDYDYHRLGLGSYMLQAAKQLLREAGYRHMLLNVNKNNRNALRAYERNGLMLEQAVVNDIGNGFVMDDYVFGCDL